MATIITITITTSNFIVDNANVIHIQAKTVYPSHETPNSYHRGKVNPPHPSHRFRLGREDNLHRHPKIRRVQLPYLRWPLILVGEGNTLNCYSKEAVAICKWLVSPERSTRSTPPVLGKARQRNANRSIYQNQLSFWMRRYDLPLGTPKPSLR